MLIFLIGYMGCGKSCLGRPLSGLMNYKFIDLDLHIETRHGMSISDIFKVFGEGYFRRTERTLLIELCESEDNCIISTGGGTPCYEDNMEVMNEYGCTIYIDTDSGILCSRLLNSKKKRPLLEGKSDNELKEFVVNSMKIREPFYKKAKIKVTGKNIKATDIYTLINNRDEIL